MILFINQSIIEKTYSFENLPQPLFALRARGPMGRRPKRGIVPPFGIFFLPKAGKRR